ncbi:uncharacterized protein [Palaemon carinicauda]|uniref:uncharacterized protein n=1 Tax=Palaemon carinicauda TaxID=392227 RepID=UPI0035B58751
MAFEEWLQSNSVEKYERYREKNEEVKRKTITKGLGRVNEYTYLGQKESVSTGHQAEIKRWICMGGRSVGRQKVIVKYKSPFSQKRKSINRDSHPVLTYTSEIWSITKSVEHKLVKTQRVKERIMMGIPICDRKRATSMRESL